MRTKAQKDQATRIARNQYAAKNGHMKRTTTFTKGSGVYTCRCCSRSTRDDGCGDSVHVRLCTQCYELAGYDNMIADNGIASLTAGEVANIKQQHQTLVERGGNPDALGEHVKKVVAAS